MSTIILKQTAIATVGSIILALGTGGSAEAIVTVDNPENRKANSEQFTGIAEIILGFGNPTTGDLVARRCTGTLLPTGIDILTAANCIAPSEFLNTDYVLDGSKAFFDLPTGSHSIEVANYFIHPGWDANQRNYRVGNDLAIVRLASEAPADAQRYDIYRNTDEVGQNFTTIGYGDRGTGETGHQPGTYGKHFGQNSFDALGDIFQQNNVPYFENILPDRQMFFDFDNGQSDRDALGTLSDIPHLGLGEDEVGIAEGDSGSPQLIEGKIAGVTSYGISLAPTDIDYSLNASFGEMAGSTRVSYFADWVDSTTRPTTAIEVPESSSIFGILAFGLSGALIRRQSQRDRNLKRGH